MDERGRPRLGFVVDWLNDSYQLEVLSGAARAAEEAGAQLIVLPGGVLGADHGHGARRNGLYRFLTPLDCDGLVVMTGTLGNAGGTDVMERVAPHFAKERICHVAVPVSGSPSVLVDNQSGMRRIIEHLILVHNRRKIAFIRGPESNAEAEARFQAYKDVLEVFKIPFDERLVAPGDFLREAGFEAINIFFEQRGLGAPDINAIVAADDLMALAAMEGLRARGVRVPSDISVVGFDDVEEARFAFPPLSTVHQPLAEQGRAAVATVLASIRSGQAASAPLLDTVCCFRRSCGCTAEDPGALTARPKSDTRMSLKDSVVRRRSVIEAELLGGVGSSAEQWESGWQTRLVSSLLETLEGREEAFREAFDQLLEKILDADVDASLGHAVTSALRRQLSVCAGDDPAQIRRVEGLLHDARILTSNAVGRSEAQRRIRLEREASAISQATVLLQSLPQAEWSAQFRDALLLLGLRTCVLLRQRDSFEAECLYAARRDGTLLAPEGARIDLLKESVGEPPEGALGKLLAAFEPETVLLEPLDDGEKMTGLAVLSWDEMRPHLVEVVRDLLGGVLNRIR